MKKIYLNSKRMMLLLASLLMLSYVHGQITVSGTVYDDSDLGGGFPLPGANIIIKGTTTGTTTDLDGKFTIEVPDKNAVLQISSVGLASQEIPVGDKTTFEVRMKEDAVAIDEVVAIGYGTQREEDLSIAATVLGADEFKDKPVLGVSQALQGKAAGVQVTANSGSPGAEMSVRIRGTGTVNNPDPLYVVDGIPIGTSCNINPADIESMSILKDASATAIYGSRGANGVVIITTKGGGKVSADGKAHSQVEFDAFRGVQAPWRKMDIADAQEYLKIQNHLIKETDSEGLPYRWTEYTGGLPYNSNDQAAKDVYNAAAKAIGAGTDWQDENFRNATMQKYQLRYSVASAKMTYSVSGAYQQQEGIVKGSDYERLNIGMKSTHRVFDNFTIGHQMSIDKSVRNLLDEGSMWTGALALTVFGDPTIEPKNDSTYNRPANNSANPAAVIEYQGRSSDDGDDINFGEETKRNASVNLWGEWEIVSGLKLKTQYAFSMWNTKRNHFMPSFDYGSLYQNPNSILVVRSDEGRNTNLNTTLTYDKKIYSSDSTEIVHAFSIMGGYEYFDQMLDYLQLRADKLYDESEEMRYLQATDMLNNITMKNDPGWQIPTPSGLLSQMGRISYGYKNKYLLTATLRRDGSSRFGDDEKYGFFPSFSVAWKLHQEPFFKNQKFLKDVNECKLRFGWGKVGNENIGNFGYIALMEANNNYVFGESLAGGQVLRSLPNQALRWESQNQSNLGIDLAFMKNKILFTADIFQKITDGMLVKVPQPDIAGTEQASYSNAAEVMNRGLEISTSYRKLEGKFHYSAGVSYTQVKNEVTDLGGGDDMQIFGGKVVNVAANDELYVSSTEVGYPIASFYGWKVDGIFQNWEEVNRSSQPNAAPGDYIFKDINKDGKIDSKDKTIIGNPHPDFTFGINLTADYKGFDLALSMQGSVGNDIYNAGYQAIMSNSQRNYHADKYEALNAWHNDANGDGIVSADEIKGSQDVIRIDPTDINKNLGEIHEGFVENASYLRIKDITLGYNLPKSITQKLKVKGIRFYAQTQNILTITKYKGFDPEIGTNPITNWEGPEVGVDRITYPIAKSFLLGVNLKF